MRLCEGWVGGGPARWNMRKLVAGFEILKKRLR